MASTIHKWLALLMAIQILFWFVSGLFFAIAPIERVRSEHMKAEAQPAPVAIEAAAAGLQRIAGEAPGERIEIRAMAGAPVALVSPSEGRPRLYDLTSGRRISPIPAALAAQIAEADHLGDQRAVRVELVTENFPEYRGALPAWRVDFDDGGNRSLYVAQDSGTVTARRSTLWRVFDFLWSLHIMDFKEHEDFNTPLLIGATFLGLVVIVTGIIMFPSRLGLNAWRRRRRARREASRSEA
ncbi:PepSY domain-containing protein [Allosphingosinicella sp.]|uniref:PepSY domain-containing protein n=1 Tax=Allosphingosinicella sp. TaxID=2823234 RepID=UPI002F028C80